VTHYQILQLVTKKSSCTIKATVTINHMQCTGMTNLICFFIFVLSYR